jgi:hypothetical protein
MKYEVLSIDPHNVKEINSILDSYKDSEIDYLFIKKSDVKVDEQAYDLYTDIMKKYDSACVFFGFSSDANALFNGKPNPMARFKIAGGFVMITRNPVSDFIGFDLSKIKDQRFDENLEQINTSFTIFLNQLHNDKLIPFFGFFFEPDEPWNFISTREQAPMTPEAYKKLLAEIDEEKKYLEKNNINLTLSTNLDEVVKYIMDKEKNNAI